MFEAERESSVELYYQINSIFYDDICVVYACLKTVSRRVVFFVEYGLDMATADVDAAIS